MHTCNLSTEGGSGGSQVLKTLEREGWAGRAHAGEVLCAKLRALEVIKVRLLFGTVQAGRGERTVRREAGTARIWVFRAGEVHSHTLGLACA